MTVMVTTFLCQSQWGDLHDMCVWLCLVGYVLNEDRVATCGAAAQKVHFFGGGLLAPS